MRSTRALRLPPAGTCSQGQIAISGVFSLIAPLPPSVPVSVQKFHRRKTKQPKPNQKNPPRKQTHKRAVISPARFLQLLAPPEARWKTLCSVFTERTERVKTLQKGSHDESNNNQTLRRSSRVFQIRRAGTKGPSVNEAPGLAQANSVPLKGEGSGRNVLPHSVWTFFFFFSPSPSAATSCRSDCRAEAD